MQDSSHGSAWHQLFFNSAFRSAWPLSFACCASNSLCSEHPVSQSTQELIMYLASN